MATLPREIFDLIYLSLASYTFPSTSRFPELTDDSKQGILAARLAWPHLCLSYPLKQLFISVMSETLFIIPTGHTYPPFPEQLEAFSTSPYATSVTTLSFRPPIATRTNVPRTNPLIRILSRFVNLSELRYYTLPRAYFRDPWVPAHNGDLILKSESATLAGPVIFRSWAILSTHYQINERLGTYLDELADCFTALTARSASHSISPIQSFRMPLHGNMAPFNAKLGDELFRSNPLFAKYLRRVEVTLLLKEPSVFESLPPAIGAWIYACTALEYLDVAFTREGKSEPRISSAYAAQPARTLLQRLLAPELEPPGAYFPTRLCEVRIMARCDILFDVDNVLEFFQGFVPCLKRVGLAHFAIARFWDSLVSGLCDMEISRVWLLNPVQRVIEEGSVDMERWRGRVWAAEDRVRDGEEGFRVKVKHVDCPLGDAAQGTGWRKFEYPGFGVFEGRAESER